MIFQPCRLKTSQFNLNNALILGFIFLGAGFVSAQNLATDPGFETGDTTGWSAFGSPAISAQTIQVHSGSYAGLVTNRTATYMGIAQSFAGVLQSGQVYNVSAWVRLISGPGQTVYLTFQKTDDSGTTYSQAASGTANASGWTQISGQYTLTYTGSLSVLTLYAELPNSATDAYYIDDLSVQPVSVTSTNGQCTVDWNTVYQRIDGFGASSAWRGTWTSSQADMFFSTNSGIGTSLDGKTRFPFIGCGFSLLRNHIIFASSTTATAIPGTSETGLMQMAQTRGARIWSTPWTPAVGFKSTNDMYDSLPITNPVNGGSYLGRGNNITNVNYAGQLANYVVSMKNNGVNLYAISVQNEPDASVNTYEACQWTGQQFHDFATNLYNALVASGVSSTKIIIPESESWPGNPGLYTPTLNDANAAADAAIIANHNYVPNNVVGDTSPPAALAVSGKALWETEVSQIGGSYDSSINNALYWAGRIHLFMTAAQANAWHYWWLIATGSDNQALTDANGIPAKRMYALGQFARFVRPNYYRINVANNTGSVLVSAYKDSGSPNFAIVVINSASTTVTQVFNLANVTGVASVTPWITSATMSLSNQPAVAVSGAAFSYALPAMSIVTFTGQSSAGGSLTLSPVADQTINAGVTLVITNVAMDSNVPPQTLTFNLLNGPTNATLTTVNGTNASFAWRPLVNQANTVNLVNVQVTDNGTPNLSATNNFTVTVNPLVRPALESIAVSGGQISMVINGTQGPDYTLLTSTDLINWQSLFTTNSPPLPFTLMDTNAADIMRFYRIQLGP
jgi:glucuronoarabinoxylan endo-1,4-beta-xylanase